MKEASISTDAGCRRRESGRKRQRDPFCDRESVNRSFSESATPFSTTKIVTQSSRRWMSGYNRQPRLKWFGLLANQKQCPAWTIGCSVLISSGIDLKRAIQSWFVAWSELLGRRTNGRLVGWCRVIVAISRIRMS